MTAASVVISERAARRIGEILQTEGDVIKDISFVGSGCWPLKIRNAIPATKAAKMSHFMEGANSRLWSNSLVERRRRVLREASPRFTSWLRLRKSNMALFACRISPGDRGGPVQLVSVDDRTNQLVPDDISLVEINKRNARYTFQSLERLDQSRAFVRGQIDLSDVSRHDAFRVRSDAR